MGYLGSRGTKSASWVIDSEPIRARGITDKYAPSVSAVCFFSDKKASQSQQSESLFSVYLL